MIAATLFFFVCALVCLIGALTTVIAKSPIRSAVGLLIAIFGIAGLYLELSAQFLAAIQLIVYAGAVVVLFVFVIMLLGPDAQAGDGGARAPRSRISRVLGAAISGLAGLLGLGLLSVGGGDRAQFGPARADHGSVEAVGSQLFIETIVPFELATLLLIVAVVGAIAVAKVRAPAPRKKPVENPTKRMFHGPIHPRDVAPPLEAEGGAG